MKLGFIGCGNMANAIMHGIIANGLVVADQIIGSDPTETGRQRTLQENGIHVTSDNLEVVRQAETVFFTIKPQYYQEMIAEIKDEIREAAMVGEGMTAACPNKNVSEEELTYAVKICDGFGKTEVVSEKLFDVVTAVSGSSPAYIFMLIEAMADAAVLGGMPRQQAYKFSAQSVLGSAKMVLETGKHPGELKDMVTSPAGTTIEAVRVLEERGFRSAVIECIDACAAKSEALRKG